MGYDGIFIEKQDISKLRTLIEKSNEFIIVSSLSRPDIDIHDNRIMVRFEDDSIIVHDMDTIKLEKFLSKNKIKY